MKFLPVIVRDRIEPRLLASLTVLVGLVLLFITIADEVFEQDTHAFDKAVLLALRITSDPSQMIGPQWLALAFRDITSLGGFTVITMVTSLSVLYLLVAGKTRNAIVLALAISLGAVAESSLKLLFSRARPDVVPHLVEVQTMSFPSGHAMMSAITYLTLGAMLARAQPNRRLRIFIISVGVFLTVSIGLSRVFLGVHWPTDILAGWTIGGAWALATWMIADALSRRKPDQPQPIN
ncbi:phosphatase PAP2 family protein [Allorhizobium terrae]|uniref:phosphatase PAP2 family protein n=1 Tax=Allorhizobium terrae TaxID=1848972 RepID=UPI001E612034|nr:phosphatase PAP2 family protein [Allorhizobium terrae]